jgi:ferredoxin
VPEYERMVHGLRVVIDPTLCVSFGDCIEVAPDAFRLDSEGIVAFAMPESVGQERLLQACRECPVDALSVWDGDGRLLVP